VSLEDVAEHFRAVHRDVASCLNKKLRSPQALLSNLTEVRLRVRQIE
jgi:hypothetical protein